MKLILLYGPPSAGKYTIGKALAERTGYKFFHNHLTVDAVRPIFDDTDERRTELLGDLRARVIEAPAVLMTRIGNESRRRLGKTTTKAGLQKGLDTRDHYATVKYPADNFRIDTTQQPPERSARLIIEHFGLSLDYLNNSGKTRNFRV